MVAQRNTILSLKMIPGVKAVVFTTDPFWLRYCKKNNLECSDFFEYARVKCVSGRSNYAGTPYFKSLIHRLEEMHSCHFYGYVNGDILISPSITDVLRTLQSSLRQAVTEKPFLVVGRRTNYPWKNVTTLPIHVGYADQLDAMCSSDAPYMSNAIVLQARTDHA